MTDTPRILFFGAGAIGGSVAAWVASGYKEVHVHARGDIMRAVRGKGITTFPGDDRSASRAVKVKTLDTLDGVRDFDVIALAVKTYSLDAVAAEIRKHAGDRPIIIAMQNGAENQSILPKYFSKVIYCVIGYNAWTEEPGVIGYQKKGPLIFGTRNNELSGEARFLARIFSRGVETVVTDRLQDAVHSKIIINLTNSLTTLIGHNVKPLSDEALFQRVLTNLLLEGVRIARAAGYGQCRIGGMPSWGLIWAGARLPRLITKGMFRRNARKMVMSSMAQDIIQRGGHDSELENINGYFLKLAEKFGVEAPFNRAVYDLCRREFAREKFTPLDIRFVWEEVVRRMK
ncbi:MAG: 2-dehydropantoate 2-reductase, partial [Spirochaetes bacterium]|nr:2-dehydropantoate 2-reductase [Spirochaetota bacterium]